MKQNKLWHKSAWMAALALLLASAAAIHAAATDDATDVTPVNLLAGSIKSTGTPADAGWIASKTVTWLSARDAMNDNGEYFRTGQKTKAGYEGTVFYANSVHVVFGYPVDVRPGKFYKLNGTLWKRNGEHTVNTYTFGLTQDVKSMSGAYTSSVSVSGNSVYENLDHNLVAIPSLDENSTTYFTWEVSALTDESQWQRGGLFDDLTLTEIGDAAYVNFVCGENVKDIETQYFLKGESYMVKAPAEPIKNDYVFTGWYTDEAVTDKFDFNTSVSESITLYAGWVKDYPNLAAGWDGNGIGNNSDIPNRFGWTATNSAMTWTTVQTGPNNECYYRDNLNPGGESARTIIHGGDTGVYAYPLKGMKKGFVYNVKLSGAFMNRAAITNYSINTKADGTGDIYGSKTVNIPQWSAHTDIEFYAIPREDGDFYFNWQSTDGGDRNILWNLTVREKDNMAVATFLNADGSIFAQLPFEKCSSAARPSDEPVNDKKVFLGWYADQALTEPFDFNASRDENATAYPSFSDLPNLVFGWDGNRKGSNGDKPNAFGWYCTNPDMQWLEVQDGYKNGAECYYRDNLDPGNGTVRILMHGGSSDIFSFPISDIEAGKGYVVTASLVNMNHYVNTVLGVNPQQDGSGPYYGKQTVYASDWNKEKDTPAQFYFKAPTDGKYYLTWQTPVPDERAMLYRLVVHEEPDVLLGTFLNAYGSVLSYSAFKKGSKPTRPADDPTNGDMMFIGWYADEAHTHAFDFTAEYQSDVTIYPYFFDGVATTPGERTISETAHLNAVANEKVTVTGDASLYIKTATPLLGNSFIDLAGDNNWLYIENMRPSKFLEKYPDAITVNGRALDVEDADRIALYRNGFVVIPNGRLTVPVELYNGENLTGEKMECYQDEFYRSEELGEKFDNRIHSFKVRKGWQLCLANNPDGTGFSKIFIAADGDLVVNTMPEGLEFASFARVSRFDWTGKKGYCNPGGLDVNVAWFYDWNIGGDSRQLDREYVAIRQNLGWPGWDDICNKVNINTVLGLNEPDHTDQSNATVKEAIEQWHNMFKTGRRLGSPTPDSLNKGWLDQFIAAADSLNYRVDFVVAHMYWNSQSGSSLKNSIQEQSRRTGWRPVWITEMNNGANWTTEWWPDESGTRLDADFNPILDASGNEQTTNRPHSEANSNKQVAWFNDVLPALDDAPNLERYAFYNWVQDARAVELGGKLTPAGKVFDAHNSGVSYRSANAYDHKWHIAPPFALASLSDDFSSAVVSWYDHNGETGTNYILEKRVDEGAWQQAKVLEPGKDYEYGATIEYVEKLDCNSRVDYRVKATSYKGGESIYSRLATIVRDNPSAPVLKAETVSCTIVRLSWEAAKGVRAYRLERSEGSEWIAVEPSTTNLEYLDEELTPEKTYSYRLVALSSSTREPASEIVNVTMPKLTVPGTVEGLFVASGDRKVTLTWDFAYDTLWDVKRAVTKQSRADYEYETIAEDLPVNSYVDNDVANGTEYLYVVEPHNDAGNGEASNAIEAIPVSGRYIYYPFDEGADDVAYDHHGGYHGKLVNNATWAEDRDGKPNSAVALAKDDKAHVQLADGLMDGMEDFTIATWVKFTGTYARLVDFGQGTGNFLIIAPSADKIRYKLTCAAGTCDVTVPASLSPNEWHHIALTQGDNVKSRAAGKTLSFYVDGEQVAQEANESGVTPADMGHSTANYLGRSQWANDSYADHQYDDMYVLDRALEPEQVASLYNTNELAKRDDDEGDVTGAGDTSDDVVKAMVENNDIVIVAVEATVVKVYAADGRLVARVHAFPGKTCVKGLASGVYIACGKKLLIN